MNCWNYPKPPRARSGVSWVGPWVRHGRNLALCLLGIHCAAYGLAIVRFESRTVALERQLATSITQLRGEDSYSYQWPRFGMVRYSIAIAGAPPEPSPGRARLSELGAARLKAAVSLQKRLTPANPYSTWKVWQVYVSLFGPEQPNAHIIQEVRAFVLTGVLPHIRQADLSGADFQGADLREIDFNGASLAGVNFGGANLAGTDFAEADLRGADFRGTNLQAAKSLAGANLAGANFTAASLRGADFREAQLMDADFRGADLRRANFSRANFGGADFSDANLEGASFTRVNLRGTPSADFTRTNLRGTNFTGANLRGTNFTGANLKVARFNEVNLRDANFRGANLADTKFARADLRGARLKGSFGVRVNPQNANSLGILHDRQTRWPGGLASRSLR